MARPLKKSLEFFPKDVDFYSDIKIKKLKRKYGVIGITIYDYLLCEIYNDEGYYTKIDDDFIFFTADYFDIQEEEIKNLLNICLELDLFNKELYLKDKILTSKGIQDRYFLIINLARKKGISILEKYDLLNINVQEPSENVQEPSENVQEPSENVQEVHKRKETKLKETKLKETKLKETKLIFPDEEFECYWKEWKDYKKSEYRFKFKNEKSEIISLQKALNESGSNIQKFKNMIYNSIANGYKGLYPDKNNNNSKQSRFSNYANSLMSK